MGPINFKKIHIFSRLSVSTAKVKFSIWNFIYIRGCSQIMSAKNGGVQTPPPPFVSHCLHFQNPPSPLCQPLSAFPQPPLPPMSAIVSISPTSPPPFVSFVSICQTRPSFSVPVLWTYLMPPPSWITYFFWKKVQYLTKIIYMSWWVG